MFHACVSVHKKDKRQTGLQTHRQREQGRDRYRERESVEGGGGGEELCKSSQTKCKRVKPVSTAALLNFEPAVVSAQLISNSRFVSTTGSHIMERRQRRR